jgi:hypothetical protein
MQHEAAIGLDRATGKHRQALADDRARLVRAQLLENLLTDLRPDLPDWIDAALERATHPDPARRPDALGEFIADLRRPAADYVARNRRPLIDRDPLAFWKGLSTVLGLAVVILLANLLA